MSTDTIIIFGAGGHAKVVLDALLTSADLPLNLLIVDDNPALIGSRVCGYPVTETKVCADLATSPFHVAIGNGVVRRMVHDRLAALGHFPLGVIHPKAVVSPFAQVGAGVFLAAQCVVAPDATIGAGTIINHGAVVDHDCHIGAFTHIAPNAVLGGGVNVGGNVLVGAGSVTLPGLTIADGARVGAGAVVTIDVAAASTVVGVPGRIPKKGI